MLKIILTGPKGQLGRALTKLKPNDVDLLSVDRSILDLSNFYSCRKLIEDIKPDWIINCGAYTNVDKAEIETDIAMRINADAPRAFAEAIKKVGGKIMQISTDFVFDGQNRNTPYPPDHKRSPIGIYAISKAKGEEAIEETLGQSGKGLILRTSWLIGPVGKNFVLTMLKLHSKGKEINVVSDQIGVPTSSLGLARACWRTIKLDSQDLLFKKSQQNILHWSDDGIASWYDLALVIGEIGFEIGLLNNKSKVNPIRSKDYPSRVTRPFYSVLESQSTKNLLKMYGVHWLKSLREIIETIKKIENKEIYL